MTAKIYDFAEEKRKRELSRTMQLSKEEIEKLGTIIGLPINSVYTAKQDWFNFDA